MIADLLLPCLYWSWSLAWFLISTTRVMECWLTSRLPLSCRLHLFAGQGIAFIHQHKQLHRDIKPGNILMTNGGVVKIADFGIAKQLESTLSFAKTSCGTKVYLAPERFKIEDRVCIDSLCTSFLCRIWATFWRHRIVLYAFLFLLARFAHSSVTLCRSHLPPSVQCMYPAHPWASLVPVLSTAGLLIRV